MTFEKFGRVIACDGHHAFIEYYDGQRHWTPLETSARWGISQTEMIEDNKEYWRIGAKVRFWSWYEDFEPGNVEVCEDEPEAV